MNEKRYRQVGSGDFRKWTDEGQRIEGVWRGQKDGQYGPLGMVDTKTGKVSFPLHTTLLDKVHDIPEGTEIEIIYIGLKTTKNGQKTYKAFNVGVAEAAPEGEAPQDTEDVPF